MPTASNDKEMEKMFEDITKAVVNEITEKIMIRLKEIIQKNVYDVPKGGYTRLKEKGGLYGAWKTNSAKSVDGITGSMEYAPELMIYNPEKAQHGWEEVGDLRDEIPKFVENAMKYKWGGNASIKRPFWKFLIQELDNGLFDKWVLEGFKSRGVEITISK
ncbi:MAG: hypothetical protein WCO84_01490 [bacterium]